MVDNASFSDRFDLSLLYHRCMSKCSIVHSKYEDYSG